MPFKAKVIHTVKDDWGEHEIKITHGETQIWLDGPRGAHMTFDLFYCTEQAKDIHEHQHVMAAIFPDGEGSDPVAFVRWYKDKIVIETEDYVHAEHRYRGHDHVLTIPIER